MVNSRTMGMEVRGLFLLHCALIYKSEHLPGPRRSSYSHNQMTSYLKIPFLKDPQETDLGGN